MALVTNTTPEEIPEPGTPLLPPLPATPIPPTAHSEPLTLENAAPQPRPDLLLHLRHYLTALYI